MYEHNPVDDGFVGVWITFGLICWAAIIIPVVGKVTENIQFFSFLRP